MLIQNEETFLVCCYGMTGLYASFCDRPICSNRLVTKLFSENNILQRYKFMFTKTWQVQGIIYFYLLSVCLKILILNPQLFGARWVIMRINLKTLFKRKHNLATFLTSILISKSNFSIKFYFNIKLRIFIQRTFCITQYETKLAFERKMDDESKYWDWNKELCRFGF
jgi:hypothetical protein